MENSVEDAEIESKLDSKTAPITSSRIDDASTAVTKMRNFIEPDMPEKKNSVEDAEIESKRDSKTAPMMNSRIDDASTAVTKMRNFDFSPSAITEIEKIRRVVSKLVTIGKIGEVLNRKPKQKPEPSPEPPQNPPELPQLQSELPQSQAELPRTIIRKFWERITEKDSLPITLVLSGLGIVLGVLIALRLRKKLLISSYSIGGNVVIKKKISKNGTFAAIFINMNIQHSRTVDDFVTELMQVQFSEQGCRELGEKIIGATNCNVVVSAIGGDALYTMRRGSLRVIKGSLQNNQITAIELLNEGEIPLNITNSVNQNDKFVVMASSALWDRLTYQQVVSLVPATATKGAAKLLVREALKQSELTSEISEMHVVVLYLR